MSLVLQKNLLIQLFLAKLCEVEVVIIRPLPIFRDLNQSYCDVKTETEVNTTKNATCKL